MKLNFLWRALFFLFLILTTILSSFSSSSFISDGVLESHSLVIGRNLLQTKKACPVNFEVMNYTVITSQCKGPKYPPKECCAAFKVFACPYAHEISDLSTDCATIMFNYINIHGKYPPGIFASYCKEGKEGLKCPDVAPPAAASVAYSSSLWLTVFAALLVFLF
ncbi:unnamed protein product [Cochlearia groenlandica]